MATTTETVSRTRQAVQSVDSTASRFLLVGFSGIVVNVVVTELALTLPNVPLALAAFIGTVVSVVSNFMLLEAWVFNDRTTGKLWVRFLGFASIAAVDYSLRAPLLIVLATLLPTFVANLFSITAMFIVRYTISHKILWRQRSVPALSTRIEEIA